MTTVSTAEAAANLSDLMTRSRSETIAIRDGRGELVYLVSAEQVRRQREVRIAAFRAARRLASEELERNLAAEGISVEEFAKDLMKGL